jgi:hypothetical protein
MLHPESKLLRSLLLTLALLPTPALADMSFYVVNDHRRAIALEFVGRDRAWPGGDKVYALDAGQKKSILIDCEEGERLCYGAWENGNDQVWWGIGPDRDKTCEHCCRICVTSGMDDVTIAD